MTSMVAFGDVPAFATLGFIVPFFYAKNLKKAEKG
jgi:hypothetical protein